MLEARIRQRAGGNKYVLPRQDHSRPTIIAPAKRQTPTDLLRRDDGRWPRDPISPVTAADDASGASLDWVWARWPPTPPGDEYTFYEINPEVWRFADARGWQAAHGEDRRGATPYFTYLDDARRRGARIEVVLGDARLSLEQELMQQGPRRFDLLVLDASAAIPFPRSC